MSGAAIPEVGALERLLERLVSMARENDKVPLRALVAAAGLDPARDFVGAFLRNHDFRDEDLNDFNFSGADLAGADFRRALTETTNFQGANLVGVIGIPKRRPSPPFKPGDREAESREVQHLADSPIEELKKEVEASRQRLNLLGADGADREWLEAEVRLADALRNLARLSGRPELASEAVEGFERTLRSSRLTDIERIALGRGAANALRVQGTLELDSVNLQRAAARLRDLIHEADAFGLSLEVAKTREQLANTLRALGERSSQPLLLQAAVEAYQSALTDELLREIPARWARVQTSLAGSLTRLSQRLRSPKLLREALAAIEHALEMQDLEEGSTEWGRTKSRQGDVLSLLGRMERNPRLIEQGIEAYREALNARTREARPLEWARTKSSLGVALSSLGARRRGLHHLLLARTAFEDALSAQLHAKATRDGVRTQLELADTLSLIALRQDSAALLEHAAAMCGEAMEVLSQSSFDSDRRRGVRVRDIIRRRRKRFLNKMERRDSISLADARSE